MWRKVVRRSASERGYGVRWRQLSKAYLAQHPHCAICARAGLVVRATVVDHITSHKSNPWRFWDPANWQPLCAPCHNGPKQRAERSGSVAYSRQVNASGFPSDPQHPFNRVRR